MSNISQGRFLENAIKAQAVRISVRSLCIKNGRLLVQCPADDSFANFAFPGGHLEFGCTMEKQLSAEYMEEMGIAITGFEYLFAVENRFRHNGSMFHGLEHYFAVEIDEETVKSRESHLEFHWLDIANLANVNLRPHIVRDAIVAGQWKNCKLLSVDPYGDFSDGAGQSG